jgi:beta-1,4-mannosyl-glycoprotein beta-1,4-N-acetylglucosaminyltransferase
MYWDEDLLLNLRLNILDKYVNYFVIVEGNRTWQDNPKKFKLKLNKLKKFKKKIIYIRVTDFPKSKNPWIRENFQRNSIMRGLIKANKNDLIMISDLDEIPNPSAIKYFDSKMRYAVFKQNHYHYKFNLQSEAQPSWHGTRVCTKKYLKSPQWLRELKFKIRPFWRIDKFRLNNIIDRGGWHFCNLKSPKQLVYKYKNLCETDDKSVFMKKISQKYLSESSIKKKIKKGLDLIGRNEIYKFKKIDKTFPKYLLKNKKLYNTWIAKN